MITVPPISQFQLEFLHGVDCTVCVLNICHMLALVVFFFYNRKKSRVMQNQQFLLNAEKIPRMFLTKT